MTNEKAKLTPAGTPTGHFYADLRQLKADCGRNKHDQALMLIAACIEEGFNTASWIIGVLKPLNMDAQHLGMILHGIICVDEASRLWRRDSEGLYSTIPIQPSAA